MFSKLTLSFLRFGLVFKIARNDFWQIEHRRGVDSVMCDMDMAPHRPGADPLPMVSTSDLCYIVALFYCFEKQIEWYTKNADGLLEKYPVGHTWQAGEKQPATEEAKAAAIGKAYWTETLDGGNTIRHYYDPCPDPVVSVLEASFGNLKLEVP